MAEALTYTLCAALVALTIALLSATRWMWKSTTCYRRRGLADIQTGSPDEEDGPAPYVMVRPHGLKQPKKAEKKEWLRP